MTPKQKTPLLSLVMLSALLLGVVARVVSLQGELWLDEAWSLLLVQAAHSPFDLLTQVKHDNNHLSNSIWMWMLGSMVGDVWFRIPSLVFSVTTLLVLGRIVQRERLGWTGCVWFVSVALSYPIILLGGEARGYSLGLLCVTLAFSSVLRLGRDEDTPADRFIFTSAATVGLFTHAIFILYVAPVALWLLAYRGVRRTLPLLAVPGLAMALLVSTFYNGMVLGGAPDAPFLQVILSACSVAFGGEELSAFDPQGAAVAACIAVAIMAIALGESLKWLREDRKQALLFISVVLAPYAALLVINADFLLPRYFIISTLFLYGIVARWLVRLGRQGVVGATIATALVVAISVGGLRHTWELYAFERSHFMGVLREVVAVDRAEQVLVSVGREEGERNRALTRRDVMKLRGDDLSRLEILEVDSTGRAPNWIIEERLERRPELPAQEISFEGAQYYLERYYPAPLLSGAALAVYQRVGIEPRLNKRPPTP